MAKRYIKIELKEPLELNLNNLSNVAFKTELLCRIKEILNVVDVQDYYAYESNGDQEITLQIDNEKSDQ
ncbi:hypothetical protein [Flavobacterium lipolyticum]|uniref:Uncharacterized protein n=1 Tax=Flavobacterium lipolyticum TaxID=2893754 RepID=A0ABS8LWK1_9FLAO|nr:hypothetical protein [Flavobacterium sp. F-126]MCC9016914.1 hypothetical protein [Flavobacterium sp. F-126]